MYSQLLVIFALFFTYFNATAQNLDFGITASLGFSQVTSNLPFSGDYFTTFAPSGKLGMFTEQRIGKNSFLGVEALWVQMEGKELTKDKELFTFNENLEKIVLGVISDKSRLHASYIGLPFYYRHEFGKFGLKGGMQTLIFLFASSNYKASGEVNDKPYEAESKTSDIELDKIDVGPKIGIDYKLNNSFRLRADYYHGLIDITPNEFPWQKKNRQLSIGVNYFFGVTKAN